MPSSKRRSFIGSVSTALALGLAGCSSVSSPDADTPREATAATAGTPDESDPLALPSVVTREGFPDGDVVLKPEGTVVLLNFFTTWCRPCQEEMPAFRRLRAAYDPERLHMVSITPEVDETLIREFWREYDGTWPVVTDPALVATERWNANSYPTNLVFDTDGTPARGDSPAVRARTFDEFAAIVDPLLRES
jgi:thiol-disulfide isomerase/thioredoxin